MSKELAINTVRTLPISLIDFLKFQEHGRCNLLVDSIH